MGLAGPAPGVARRFSPKMPFLFSREAGPSFTGPTVVRHIDEPAHEQFYDAVNSHDESDPGQATQKRPSQVRP